MSKLQRFFFDDGTSRKRWHIQQTGKQVIVSSGRLGGSLRESKSTFQTPAEAKKKALGLVAAKKKEGYVEIDPSRLEIIPRKGMRRPTERQVASFEKELGCRLPDEYRQFLLAVNGGRPNPDCVAVPGMAGIDNVGVGTLFRLQPTQPDVDELRYELDNTGRQLPPGHLPISGSSDIFTLSLRAKSFGCVYWWFHETEEVGDDDRFLESAGYLLAGSFDEFLTRIAGLFGTEEDAQEAATSSRPDTKPRATLKRLLRLMSHDLTTEKVGEIELAINDLRDLSGIADGEWPFRNLDNAAVLERLLEAGLNPEITDTEGHSLLWLCAGNAECVELLLDRGVNVNRRSGGDFETALMRAIYLESLPAVRRLLKAGANPTLRLSWPIEDALEANKQIRKVIENARADWKKGKGSRPPAHTSMPAKAAVSAKKGPKPTIKRLLKLLKHDYIPEVFEELPEVEEVVARLGDLSGIEDGQWPTIDRLENPDLLRCLLDAGLNPEITAKDGGSLLSQCVGSPDCIDLLLARGVAIDRRFGPDQSTALMRATYKGDEECLQRLLDGGADPTLEFTRFANVMLNMNEKKKALIESARQAWKRKHARG